MSRHYETVCITETGTRDGIDAVDIDSRSSLRGISIPISEWRAIVEDYAKAFAVQSDWYKLAQPEHADVRIKKTGGTPRPVEVRIQGPEGVDTVLRVMSDQLLLMPPTSVLQGRQYYLSCDVVEDLGTQEGTG